MAKYRYAWTEEKIQKYMKEGRGSGKGKEYIPWLKVQSMSSRGRSSRIKGIKNQRIVHLLSDVERNYFYMLDFVDEILDIREQYPLDRSETMAIADRLGYKHPMDSKTSLVLVMTTDFLITVKDGNNGVRYLARSTKRSEELSDRRTFEKLDIERVYWEEQGVDWRMVTEKEMPKAFVKNLIWMHPSYDLEDGGGMPQEELASLCSVLKSRLMKETDVKIKDLLDELDEKYHFQSGVFLAMFRHLLARKIIRMKDWTIPFSILQRSSEFILREGAADDVGGESTYLLGG